jgi:hypothetical protein
MSSLMSLFSCLCCRCRYVLLPHQHRIALPVSSMSFSWQTTHSSVPLSPLRLDRFKLLPLPGYMLSALCFSVVVWLEWLERQWWSCASATVLVSCPCSVYVPHLSSLFLSLSLFSLSLFSHILPSPALFSLLSTAAWPPCGYDVTPSFLPLLPPPPHHCRRQQQQQRCLAVK